MADSTFEAFVEHGQIRLPDHVKLPEKTKVLVFVPGSESSSTARIYSPRLAHPEQVQDFAKQVIETSPDAAV